MVSKKHDFERQTAKLLKRREKWYQKLCFYAKMADEKI